MIEFLKNPYVATIIVVLCILLFRLASSGNFLSKFINKLFPCNQNPLNPLNSFPCYGWFDIALMIIVAVIGVIFLGILVFDLYKLIFIKS